MLFEVHTEHRDVGRRLDIGEAAAQRVQCIAGGALQPAALHAVVGLGVTDGRLDGLAAFEQPLVVLAHGLVAAPVDDLHRRACGPCPC